MFKIIAFIILLPIILAYLAISFVVDLALAVALTAMAVSLIVAHKIAALFIRN